MRPMRPAVLLLLAILSVNAGAQAPAGIQTPEAAFGFRMGADRELADWPSLQKLFRRPSPPHPIASSSSMPGRPPKAAG